MVIPVAPITALHALDGFDVTTADAVSCQRWLADARPVRGFLDANEALVLARLDELAESGESFGSEDASTRCSGVSSGEAAKRTRRANTLEQVAGFAGALAAGDITAEHADALAAVGTRLTAEVRAGLFARADQLLRHACKHDPGRFGRHARDIARNLEREAGTSRERQQREATFLACKIGPDGMYDVRARLDPLLGNRLIRAIDAEVAARIAAGEAAGDHEFLDRRADRARLAAEALVDLVSGGHQMKRPAVADVTVLIDAESLATGEHHDATVCETSHGAPLPISSVRALMCMGLITPVMLDTNGTVLNLGRSQRLPNRDQRRALRAMYRTCAAHGCDVPYSRCEVHHIVEWEHHGNTDLDALIPLCSRHHHQVHRQRWRLSLDSDRTLTVTDRHGEIVMVTTPDMPHPSRSGHHRLRLAG